MSDDNGSMRASGRGGVIRRAMGHWRTIAPAMRDKLVPHEGPEAVPWRAVLPNEEGDPVVRSGSFTDVEGKRQLLVILHGMGGQVDRGYCVKAARAARRANMPCLRLALRGADGRGADLHHAGFVDDLGPLLATPPWDRFEKIGIVGYSLGGHVALAAACANVDERLSAAASICAPLDLKVCQEALDSPRGWIYRRYLLNGMKRTYAAIARGGRASTPPERVAAVRTIREWDALTVVPRFGFRDVDHYYGTQSVGPKLKSMSIPSLVVVSPDDPMVPADSMRGPLGRASQKVVVRWVKNGGHVSFPPDVDLGFGNTSGVEDQVMTWMAAKLA